MHNTTTLFCRVFLKEEGGTLHFVTFLKPFGPFVTNLEQVSFGSVLTQLWLSYGSVMVQLWLSFESVMTFLWLSFDSVMTQFLLSFGSVLTQF